VKGQTYGIVCFSLDVSVGPLSAPVILLIVRLVETGERRGFLEWADPVIQDSGAKFYMIRVCSSQLLEMIYLLTRPQHCDLHEILYNAAVDAGAKVIFDTRVCLASSPSLSGPSPTTHTSRERPSVQLSDGTVLEADLILGADGPSSTVRSFVLKQPIKPRETGTVAFSGNVPIRKILEDDLISNIANTYVTWMGPRRCFFGKSSLKIGCRLLFITL
jgi:salicylate hydroxylase